MNENQPPRDSQSWRISWLTIVLALLAVGTFFAISDTGVRYLTSMGVGRVMESGTRAVPPSATGMPMMDQGVSNQVSGDSSAYYYPDKYPYPYPSPDVPVGDAREFLKVYYNASMLTRDVPSLTRRVETVVRGYDGRIDQESSSPRYGSVGFAISNSRYDAFRAELESLVDSRFITVNISSQNMLSQKVSIEEQQKQADKALADYKTVRQKIVSAHASMIQSLQARINATQDAGAKATLEAELSKENASYTAQLARADAGIKSGEDWVKGVQTQDQTLLANVATVTGTVSIQWISLWDIAQLYLPGYWIPTIFAFLTFLSFLRDRRRPVYSHSK